MNRGTPTLIYRPQNIMQLIIGAPKKVPKFGTPLSTVFCLGLHGHYLSIYWNLESSVAVKELIQEKPYSVPYVPITVA